MEVVQMEETPTPSWLSIITKAKRFAIDANANRSSNSNNRARPDHDRVASSSWGQQDQAIKIGVAGHPKKVRRHRIPSFKSNLDDDYPSKRMSFNVVDLTSPASSSSGCSSVSSSPSPGLLSCEEESTSTSILAFSSTSSSPRHQFGSSLGLELMHSSSYQDKLFSKDDRPPLPLPLPHPHSFHCHDVRERLPEISISPLPPPTSKPNQISVIKSTSSFLRTSNNSSGGQHQVCDDEPQDLSMKPKRFSSFTTYKSSSTGPFMKEEDCVQDLSFPNRISSGSNIITLPSSNCSRSTTIITNSGQLHKNNQSNTNDLKESPKQQPQEQRLWKVKLSSLISAGSDSSGNSSLSKLKTEKIDSTDSNVSSFSTISLSSDSSHCNNLNRTKSVTIVDNAKDDEDNGELVIVESDSCKKKSDVDYQTCSPEKLPVNILVKVNGKIHDLEYCEASPTKDIHAETEAEVEVEVKSRRGRKRKDEEAIGTRFDCFLCSFTGVKENVLRNHMIRMHTVKGNRGNVKCTVCGYACPTMEELRSHQELIHMQDSKTDGKPAFHACHHCTKKFRSQSQLDAHLRLIAQKQLWKDLKTRRMLN